MVSCFFAFLLMVITCNNKSQCTSNTLHYYIGSDTGYTFVCYDNDKTMHIYL